jgi:ribose-phosphate pyrophosphokinase
MRIRILALGSTQPLGIQVASRLGTELTPYEERHFEDGEWKVRPLASVRDCDTYLLASLYGEPEDRVHDKLCRLLFLVGAVKDASASRVTAVLPYLCYARKDARTKARDPLMTRYVAQLLEAVGVDRVVTMDVHNVAAFQNAFRCPAEHVEARPLLVEHVAGRLRSEPVTVLSPDPGGVKRADRFRAALERRLERRVEFGFAEKYRSGGVVSGTQLVGPLEGRTVVVVDDLISTATTLTRVAEASRARGAGDIFGVATHGLFTGEAGRLLGASPYAEIIVTGSVPPFRLTPPHLGGKLVVLDVAPLFADVIGRLHSGQSLSALGGDPAPLPQVPGQPA